MDKALSPTNSENQECLKLILYQDAFEIVNPIGSATKKTQSCCSLSFCGKSTCSFAFQYWSNVPCLLLQVLWNHTKGVSEWWSKCLRSTAQCWKLRSCCWWSTLQAGVSHGIKGMKVNSVSNALKYFHVCQPGLPPCHIWGCLGIWCCTLLEVFH